MEQLMSKWVALGTIDMLPLTLVIDEIAEAFGIERSEMLTKTRKREVAEARFTAYHVAKKRGWSLHQMMSLFYQDHATAYYGSQKFLILCETDKFFRKKVQKFI